MPYAAPGGRGSPPWASSLWIQWNQRKTREWKGLFSRLSLSSPWTLAALLSLPAHSRPGHLTRWNSVGGSLVTGKDHINYVPETEGRKEWPFYLHPLPQKLYSSKHPLVCKWTKARWEMLYILGENFHLPHMDPAGKANHKDNFLSTKNYHKSEIMY